MHQLCKNLQGGIGVMDFTFMPCLGQSLGLHICDRHHGHKSRKPDLSLPNFFMTVLMAAQRILAVV